MIWYIIVMGLLSLILLHTMHYYLFDKNIKSLLLKTARRWVLNALFIGLITMICSELNTVKTILPVGVFGAISLLLSTSYWFYRHNLKMRFLYGLTMFVVYLMMVFGWVSVFNM